MTRSPAAKAVTLQEALDQIELCDFRDAHGHPLRNNVGMIALVEYARVNDKVRSRCYEVIEECEGPSMDMSEEDQGMVALAKGILSATKGAAKP